MPVPPIVLQPQNRVNRYYILTAIISSCIIWTIFKLLYPYPFITIDSYYYIGAAYENANAGSWPIGYSKFIRLVGFISHSHTLIVTIQYVLLQASFLYFFLTIRNTFQFGKWTSLIFYILLFFNPLFIYASNHIMSDIIFCSLSLCWICQLLSIINNPKPYMIITQAVLVTAIFTIRYTALFYPLFSIIVILISHQSIWRKIAGITLTILLLGSFIQFTRIEMEKIGGVRQFSSAGGWKQASNALYMYEHISAADNNPIPERFKILHQLIKNYFNGPHTHVDLYHIDQEFTTGSFYVAAHESPLMQYLRIKQGENADIFDFKNIAPFGPYFNAYGNYLILHHTIAYSKYVVIPNIIAYLSPFPEIYGTTNDLFYLWSNHSGDLVKNWFGLTSISIPITYIKTREILLYPYSFIFSIVHFGFLVSLVGFFIIKSLKNSSRIMKFSILIIISLCISHFVFTSLFAASVLRFQFTFIILEATIATFIINHIYKNNT